jgi:hypothetical protein
MDHLDSFRLKHVNRLKSWVVITSVRNYHYSSHASQEEYSSRLFKCVCTLNLLNVISGFCTVAMFLIVDIQTEFEYIMWVGL